MVKKKSKKTKLREAHTTVTNNILTWTCLKCPGRSPTFLRGEGEKSSDRPTPTALLMAFFSEMWSMIDRSCGFGWSDRLLSAVFIASEENKHGRKESLFFMWIYAPKVTWSDCRRPKLISGIWIYKKMYENKRNTSSIPFFDKNTNKNDSWLCVFVLFLFFAVSSLVKSHLEAVLSTFKILSCTKGPFNIYAWEWAGKIHQKAQQNFLTPFKEIKKGMTPLNGAFKNWLALPLPLSPRPPPPKKKNKRCM